MSKFAVDGLWGVPAGFVLVSHLRVFFPGRERPGGTPDVIIHRSFSPRIPPLRWSCPLRGCLAPTASKPHSVIRFAPDAAGWFLFRRLFFFLRRLVKLKPAFL
jgi:hypothetical protein